MSILRRRSAHAAVILAIGAVALAGCGGSSSGGKSTVSPGSAGGNSSTPTPTHSPSSGSGGAYGY
ncbi:MAG TPA: hypothetical protein VHD81_06290 [Mycobacteriales bacterium]|nr:hypothetical protein [Mycobacteriales bacterium]